ncbi:hypothetical protein V8G54_020240, partial [Vigna mungo]
PIFGSAIPLAAFTNLSLPPHKVSNHQRCRPRHPLTTVHKHPPTLFPNILKVVKHIIQDTSNVLGGTILQPQSPIHKISLKVFRTHKPHTIQHMSDTIMEDKSSFNLSPLLPLPLPPGVVGGCGHSPMSSEPAFGHSSRLRRAIDSGCSGGKQDRALQFCCDRGVSGGGGNRRFSL